MKEIILKAENLIKSFDNGEQKNTVLNNISLELYKGDFTVVMGSSGAGKSTLLYTLNGMDAPTSGKVFFGDREITNLNEKKMAVLRRKNLGFVFQKTHLVSTLTLYENILTAALNCGEYIEKQAIDRTNFLMERMNLKSCKNRFPSSVSGGEAQRTALARAVVSEPDIIFADEPTGALNKANSEEVLQILSDLSRKGQTILMVTHDVNAALHGNRILYMEDGAIKGELNLESNLTDKQRKETLSVFLKEQRW